MYVYWEKDLITYSQIQFEREEKRKHDQEKMREEAIKKKGIS